MPPEYLKTHYLKDARTGRFGRLAKGVGIHHLGAQRFAEMPVAIPPLAEQKRIVNEFERRQSIVLAGQKIVKANLLRMERFRQSILQQAFSGYLVPHNPDD